MNFLGIFVFVLICFQIRDTAHTKGLGRGVSILIESTIIQVPVIIVTTAAWSACPYAVRVAVAIVGARAAAAVVRITL